MVGRWWLMGACCLLFVEVFVDALLGAMNAAVATHAVTGATGALAVADLHDGGGRLVRVGAILLLPLRNDGRCFGWLGYVGVAAPLAAVDPAAFQL